MDRLDTYTIFILATFLNIFLSVYLLFFQVHYRLSKGIPLYVLSLVSLTASSILFTLTGIWEPIFTVVFSNTICYIGLLTTSLALQLILNEDIGYKLLIILTLTVILLFVEQYIFVYIHPNINIRIITVSTFTGIAFLHSVCLLYKQRKQTGLPGKLLITLYTVMIFIFTLRIIHIIIHPISVNTLLDIHRGIHIYSILFLVLFIITSSFGFILLLYEKLHQVEQKQNREKVVLLQELYHRTKNNMLMISSLLKLQRYKSDSEEVKKELQITENRIEAMALAHQKLYQSKDLSEICLKDYVNELMNLIVLSKNAPGDNIKLESDIEAITVLIDIAIPTGLILSELINNCYQHAFPYNSGIITVKIKQPFKDKISIKVKDNGIGLPSEFNLEETNSLGLQTVYNIVKKQLDGELNYETNEGLTWNIEFDNISYNKRV